MPGHERVSLTDDTGPVHSVGSATETGVVILIRYFAAARQAVGLDEESLRLPEGTRIADLMELPRFSAHAVFAGCSFLVNSTAAARETRLRRGDNLDVLPPFAGG